MTTAVATYIATMASPTQHTSLHSYLYCGAVHSYLFIFNNIYQECFDQGHDLNSVDYSLPTSQLVDLSNDSN